MIFEKGALEMLFNIFNSILSDNAINWLWIIHLLNLLWFWERKQWMNENRKNKHTCVAHDSLSCKYYNWLVLTFQSL